MATQKGRNWSSGDIVTAANLSSIERGVSAVAEEYTPTTWANGDTVTAAALNNIEQGIANAGGDGGSNTITVTVVNQEANSYFINLSSDPPIKALFYDDNYNGYNYYGSIYTDGGQTATGSFLCIDESFCLFSPTRDITVTGDATDDGFDEAYEMTKITVTGDCTITILDSSGGQIAA